VPNWFGFRAGRPFPFASSEGATTAARDPFHGVVWRIHGVEISVLAYPMKVCTYVAGKQQDRAAPALTIAAVDPGKGETPVLEWSAS
jgi:hypothetical protein